MKIKKISRDRESILLYKDSSFCPIKIKNEIETKKPSPTLPRSIVIPRNINNIVNKGPSEPIVLNGPLSAQKFFSDWAFSAETYYYHDYYYYAVE